jgi:hypothetical protein
MEGHRITRLRLCLRPELDALEEAGGAQSES